MKLSIVILCWNDHTVIADCIHSIYANTHSIDFEVIVSDNGSTDDTRTLVVSVAWLTPAADFMLGAWRQGRDVHGR